MTSGAARRPPGRRRALLGLARRTPLLFLLYCPRASSNGAYTGMKTPIDLANWPPGVEWDHRPPALQALEAKLVNEADLLRLKTIARLHARGLPPHISWADLLQESFKRVLEGSRRQPDGVPTLVFLAGVMRSIKEQYWRETRRVARQAPKMLAELECADLPDSEPRDPQPSCERHLIALQELEAISRLFEADLEAQLIISAFCEGWTPEETCTMHAISRTDYDSIRRRIRRVLIKAGLRTPQP